MNFKFNFHSDSDVVALDDAQNETKARFVPQRIDLHPLSQPRLVVIIGLVVVVSDIFNLSQAVRTAPNENWTRNGNIISISAAYILVGSPLIRSILTVAKAEMHDVGQLVISLAFCPKRWLLVRLKLARVP